MTRTHTHGLTMEELQQAIANLQARAREEWDPKKLTKLLVQISALVRERVRRERCR